MKREQDEFIDQMTQIYWFMRGGIGREEAWNMCYKERLKVTKLISENIERFNKVGTPI